MDIIPPVKRCSKCGIEYPATSEYFYVDTRIKSKIGFRNPCKSCQIAKERLVRTTDVYRQRERERSAERRKLPSMKIYHAAYMREYNKEYRQTDVYKLGEKRRKKEEWQRISKSPALMESRKMKIKEWMKTPKGRVLSRRRSLNRVVREINVSGNYSSQDIVLLYEEQDGKCAYCGISIYFDVHRDLHVDHVIALANGGTNEVSNIVITCQYCNCSKSDTSLAKWMEIRGW